MSAWEIVGLIGGLVGTFLLASRRAERREYRFVAFCFYLVGNCAFMIYALKIRSWSILILYGTYQLIGVKGIWTNRPRRKR